MSVTTTDPPEAQRSDATAAYQFAQSGEIWNLRFGAEAGQFPHLKGFSIIQRLLGMPHHRFSATELHAIAIELDRVPQPMEADLDEYSTDHTAQEAADALTRRQVNARLKHIKKELRQAEHDEATARVTELRDEQRKIETYLNSSRGLGGRRRTLGPKSQEEAARSSVWLAIKRAKERLGNSMPQLKDHLDNYLRNRDASFAYSPPPHTRIEWEFTPDFNSSVAPRATP